MKKEALIQNYHNFKEDIDNKLKLSISIFKAKYEISDFQLREFLKINSFKEKVVFKKPSNIKMETYDQGFTDGKHDGARIQAGITVNSILEYLVNNHLIENNISSVDFTAFIGDLNYIGILKKIKYFLSDNYDINYVVAGENVYAEHSEDYFLLFQKDKSDDNFEITYISYRNIVLDYKLDKSDIQLLKSAYNFDINERGEINEDI